MKRHQQLQIPDDRGGSPLVETLGLLRGSLADGDPHTLEPIPSASPATIWLPTIDNHLVVRMRW
jgi:hypothetical protein